MGQTVSDHHQIDSDGNEWWERLFCPYCGDELAPGWMADEYYPDDVCGCDGCGETVAFGSAEIRWVCDETGEESA